MTFRRGMHATLLPVLLVLGASACGVDSSSPRAITPDEALQVRVGSSKEDVVDELGEPAGTFEPSGPERSLVMNPRRAACIYYPGTQDVQGAQGWRFCFDEKDELFSRAPG